MHAYRYDGARDIVAVGCDVAGSFVDAMRARGAVDALQRGGVEAGRIRLVGATIEREAAARDTRERDRASVLHVGARAAAGAFAGGALGGLIGFIVGSLVYGLPSPMAAGLWAFTLAGAVGVGSAGAIVAGVRSLSLEPEWELTFTPDPGAVAVAVHAEDAEEALFAEDVLRATGAREVRRYGSYRRAG